MSAFKLLGIKANRRHVEQMMAQVDPDGSGEIEFDEFASIMGGSINSQQQSGGADDVSRQGWLAGWLVTGDKGYVLEACSL
jgi:hypothetical protein